MSSQDSKPQSPCTHTKRKHSFQRGNTNHNTLWFIANGMARTTGPQGSRPYKSGPSPVAPLGPCYNCGKNHWVQDCPYLRKDKPQTMGLQPLLRFCNDCGVKHLV